MSYLIKGKTMPESCLRCRFRRISMPGHKELCIINDKECRDREFMQRHKDCPCVKIPDTHGRLIDADALLKMLNSSGNYVSTAILAYIEAAPTIIEAEGKDEACD